MAFRWMLLSVDQIEIFGAGIRSFHNECHPSIRTTRINIACLLISSELELH